MMTIITDMMVPPLLFMVAMIAMPAAVLAYVIVAILLVANKGKWPWKSSK